MPQIGKIEAKQGMFIHKIRKKEAERTLFFPQIGKIEAKRSLFIPQIRKIEAERTRLIPEIGKIEAKKNELDRSKTNRGSIFNTFMEPRNRFQGIYSGSLCPGRPVQQPYSSSVPSPLRLL